MTFPSTTFISKVTNISAVWLQAVNDFIANYVAPTTQTITNIAALRLTETTTKTSVHTEGYYTPGDGGDGEYWADLTDTTSLDNGITIIVSAGGVRWKLFRTGPITTKQCGAKGDGVTDDYAALNNAFTVIGGRELRWARGTYLHSNTLIPPTGQSWTGPGGQRVVIIRKAFNGNSVQLTDLNTLRDLDFDCQGATYTGGGIYVGSGFSHTIQRVRVYDSYDVTIDFPLNVGAGSACINVEAGTTLARALTTPAIRMRDNTACPRFFTDIWLSGGLLDIQSGGNGSTFHQFYIGNIITDANTALFHMVGGRVASLAAATVLSGADNQISDVAFSGPVFLNSAQGWMLSNNTYGAGCFVADVNSQYNSFDVQATTYTPTWTQASGIQPALNDGTITGIYNRNGYTACVQFNLKMGAATTFGNNAVGYRISLPYQGHIAYTQKYIPVQVYDASTTTQYTVWGEIPAGEAAILFAYGSGVVQSSSPITFAVDDMISGHFTYLVR